jgi:flagellar biogenesis protein FliO
VDFFNALAAAGFVVAALILVAWKFGRIKPGGRLLRLTNSPKNRPLASSDRIRLTPQHSVHIVSAGGKTLLVGCHSGGMVLLAELAAADLPVSDKKAA